VKLCAAASITSDRGGQSLTQDEIPPALLAKDPELAAVGEALEQIRDGKAVTARCVKCGKQLLVEGVAATGTLVI
jgi:hypothetical protein